MRSQNINKNATQRKSLDRNCSSSACGDPAGAEIQKTFKSTSITLKFKRRTWLMFLWGEK